MYQDEKTLVIPLILIIDADNIYAYGKYPWRVLVSLWGSSKGGWDVNYLLGDFVDTYKI